PEVKALLRALGAEVFDLPGAGRGIHYRVRAGLVGSSVVPLDVPVALVADGVAPVLPAGRGPPIGDRNRIPGALQLLPGLPRGRVLGGPDGWRERRGSRLDRQKDCRPPDDGEGDGTVTHGLLLLSGRTRTSVARRRLILTSSITPSTEIPPAWACRGRGGQ